VPEELERLRRLRGRDHVPGPSHGDKCQAVVHHAPAANLQKHEDTALHQNNRLLACNDVRDSDMESFFSKLNLVAVSSCETHASFLWDRIRRCWTRSGALRFTCLRWNHGDQSSLTGRPSFFSVYRVDVVGILASVSPLLVTKEHERFKLQRM
jgi:hypothetical protein